jgi:hypothetical protein
MVMGGAVRRSLIVVRCSRIAKRPTANSEEERRTNSERRSAVPQIFASRKRFTAVSDVTGE